MKKKIIAVGLTSFALLAMAMFHPSPVYASPQAKNDGNVGYRIVVDGASWGIIEDKQALTQMLDEYKTGMLKTVSGEVALKSSEFTQKIEVVEVEALPSTFTSIPLIKEKIQSEVASEVHYIVKKGDSVWAIAKTNKVPLATILKLNPTLNPKRIWAGQKIILQPKDPVIDVVTDLQTSIFKPIAFTTVYVNDANLAKGKKVVATQGVTGSQKITYDVHLVNGYVESKVISKDEQVVAPINTVVKVGTKVPAVKKPIVKKPVAPKPVVKKPVAPKPAAPKPVVKAPVAPKPVAPKPVVKAPVAPKPVVKTPIAPKPIVKAPVAPKPAAPKPVAPKPAAPRPVSRDFGVVYGRLSSDYGYRNDPFTGERVFHTGIDIATSAGSPVYVYASGTVVESSFNSVRGNYITVDHGNGLKTSYLHLSTRLVKVGQNVQAKEQIGKVGMTGSATGYHLHFTVIKNGKLVSPWDYV